MSNVANIPGMLIPGTKVQASFPSFPGPFPDLYDKTHHGSLNLASVNAGNSDTLCVGLGGVNFAFYAVLTGAGQKSANLNPIPASGNNKPCSSATVATALDDYQGRHLKLLAKAGKGGTATETYSATNPCQFAYLNATQRKGAPSTEGICFVDVFDPKLCPAGDAKNAAMLYMIPPNGSDYSQKADFLAAVQFTAGNMIETIAAYNAIAAKQGLPMIEALRNTLYSSNNYKFHGVTNDEIARAIFAGFLAALTSNPNTGLVELQFPVNTGKDRLFEAVQADLTANTAQPPAQQPAPNQGRAHRVARVPSVRFQPRRRVAENSDSESEGEGSDTDDENDIELAEVDENGVPVGQVTSEGQSVPNQAQAVNSAANQDLNLLQQGQPTRNYGQIPRPRYAAANSPMTEQSRGGVFRATSNIYGNVSHDMIADAPNPADSPALRAAKQAKVAVDAVRDASYDMLNAPDLTTAKAKLDLAKQQAQAARHAATTADTAAKNAEQAAVNDDEDAAAAAADRNYANAADEIASGAEATTESMELHYEDLKRSEAARTAPKRRLFRIMAVFAAVFTTLGLLWTFLFGYGRKIVKNGAGRFFTKDLDISALDTDTSVDIDVVAELEKAVSDPFIYIKAVHMADDQGKPSDNVTNAGTWVAAGTHITYTPSNPKPSTPPFVSYLLEADGPVAASFTDSSKLTVTFTKMGITPPQPGMPTDKIKAAPDRTSTVPFAVDAGFSFDGGVPTDPEGTWSYDSAKTQAAFTPNKGTPVAAPIKIATYRLDANGNTAKLIALFPAKPLGPTPGSREAGFTFPAADYDITLLDTTGQPTQKPVVQTGIGTWSISNRQIQFAPDAGLAATPPRATVDYSYIYSGVPSVKASATLTLPPAGQSPVASSISKLTADRKKTITFDLIGASPSGSWTDPNGTWAATGTQVTFTPNQPLAAGQINATVSYTLSNAAGTSNVAKLTVTYLPGPSPLPQTATRLTNPVVNIGTGNAAATAPYSIQLWDAANSKPVPTITNPNGGFWSVDSASRTITFHLPYGSIDPKDPVSAQGLLRFTDPKVSASYVLVADASSAGGPTPDGSHSDPALITVTFITTPVAYDVGAVFPYFPSNSASVDVLKHIVAPAGFSKVRLSYQDDAMFSETQNSAVVAFWTYVPPTMSAGPLINFLQAMFVAQYSLAYTIVDANGMESNSAQITLKVDPMAMPQTGTLLLAEDVTAGKAAAMDILTPSSSFFDKDPKSVRFIGLQDLEDDTLPPDALLRNDGKAISVPGEGVWMVGDDGKVAFQGEPGLAGVPTPALVQFADVKGNWSNVAPIVIDANLAQIPAIGAALTKMDDGTFWATFTTNLAQALPNQSPLTPEEFIAGTLSLAGAVRTQVQIGRNPVTRAALDAAYAKWDAAGQPWDPSDDATNHLVAIATATVPVDKTPLLSRYWTLDTISRMLTRGLPDS